MLAVDLPSGLDGDRGEAWDPTIRATETLTLALPKRGCLLLPPALGGSALPCRHFGAGEGLSSHGLMVGPIFAKSDIIPVDLT
jgi:YjeF-like protein